MEFLGKLGIDIKLLIAQIINFSLLLWFLKRFLYKAIIRRIEEDEKKLNEAQVERQKLGQEKEQNKQDLRTTKKQARQVIYEAKEMAERIKERARKEAEEEKAKTIEQIHKRLKEIADEKNK